MFARTLSENKLFSRTRQSVIPMLVSLFGGSFLYIQVIMVSWKILSDSKRIIGPLITLIGKMLWKRNAIAFFRMST